MIDEGRARGDYRARTYSLSDSTAALACGLAVETFCPRCWDTGSLMELTIGTDHVSAVMGHFYAGRHVDDLGQRHLYAECDDPQRELYGVGGGCFVGHSDDDADQQNDERDSMRGKGARRRRDYFFARQRTGDVVEKRPGEVAGKGHADDEPAEPVGAPGQALRRRAEPLVEVVDVRLDGEVQQGDQVLGREPDRDPDHQPDQATSPARMPATASGRNVARNDSISSFPSFFRSA